MLSVVGFALLLVIGAAAAAEANDGAAGKGTAVVAQQGVATLGRRSLQQPTTPVQLTEALTTTQFLLRGTSSAGFRRERVSPAALPPERRETDGSPALPWLSQGKSALSLPVTGRLTLGIGYRRVEGEDLWRRYAEAGSIDYDSHDFLLHAHWRF
jgi:hypothetical protein